MMLFYNDFEVNFNSKDWLELSFGQALRELRRFETMTMSELAKKSNVSQSYISQLENNVRLPSEKVIEDLSLALAKGKAIKNDDPFPQEDDKPFYDTYTDEFQVETRQQDIADLLRKVKIANESKAKRDEYLTVISNGDGENVTLSSYEINFLDKINKLDEKGKKFVLDFIDFLSLRKDL